MRGDTIGNRNIQFGRFDSYQNHNYPMSPPGAALRTRKPRSLHAAVMRLSYGNSAVRWGFQAIGI
jgi:hypothetical protein